MRYYLSLSYQLQILDLGKIHMGIFRLKALSELRKELGKSNLKKNLGALDLILLGLGGIIGTGIFVITGLAAAQYAGPAITVSFALGAVVCVFTALAYSELAAMLPVSGSAYSYAYLTMGEVVAAMVGWIMLMVFSLGGATVAAGWSGYMVGVLKSLGFNLMPELTQIPSQGGWINLPAVSIVLLLTLMLYRGTKEATRLNGILVVVKLAAIFLFIAAAAPHANPVHWEVFAPNGFFGIAAGAGFIFIAYTGFDTLATAAEECKNPNRDLPLGIIGSLVGSAILYVIVSALLTAIVPYQELNSAEPMAVALRANGIQMGAKLVATGAIAGMTTVMLTQLYGQSRILMVMARDGLFPSMFNRLHPKFATPSTGVLVSGLLMATIAGFAPVGTLGQLSSMSTLIVFAAVSLAVMIMRKKAPLEKRPFVCPAVYGVATLSMVMCIFLFLQLFIQNWLPFLAMLGLGLGVYFVYGYKNSTLNNAKK